MLNKLPEQLHEWLDGELPGEDFRQFIAKDNRLRQIIKDERKLRVLIGYALVHDNNEDVSLRSGHINSNNMSAYLDENLSQSRMHAISRHLVNCKRCFKEYLELYLLDIESINPEPLPKNLFHELLERIQPDVDVNPGILGELVFLVTGGIKTLLAKQDLDSIDLDMNESILDLDESDYLSGLLEDISPLRKLKDEGRKPRKIIHKEVRREHQRKEPTMKAIINKMVINEVISNKDIDRRYKSDRKYYGGAFKSMASSEKIKPIELEVNGLMLKLLQKKVDNLSSLSIDVMNLSTNNPEVKLNLSLELKNGESISVMTDEKGHAYFLMPRGKSHLRIGNHGRFSIHVV